MSPPSCIDSFILHLLFHCTCCFLAFVLPLVLLMPSSHQHFWDSLFHPPQICLLWYSTQNTTVFRKSQLKISTGQHNSFTKISDIFESIDSFQIRQPARTVRRPLPFPTPFERVSLSRTLGVEPRSAPCQAFTPQGTQPRSTFVDWRSARRKIRDYEWLSSVAPDDRAREKSEKSKTILLEKLIMSTQMLSFWS